MPCKYDYEDIFSEGLAKVRINWEYGFINKEGKEVIPLKYDDAESFFGSIALVFKGEINKYESQKKGKYGYINQEGKKIIPLKYNYAESSSEGLVLVFKGKQINMDPRKKVNTVISTKQAKRLFH